MKKEKALTAAREQDEFETMDLSDNEIGVLENFPLLKRLGTLFVANNKIRLVKPGLGRVLPRLEVLVLTNNSLESLGDVAALGELPQLCSLSLLHNPVTQHEAYRAFVVFKCKSLETLDFTKVTRKERYRAQQLFAGEVGGELLRKLEGSTSAAGTAAAGAGEGGGEAAGQKRQRASEAEEAFKGRVVRAIQQAKTLDEVAQLQRALLDQVGDKVLPLLEQIEASYQEGGGKRKKTDDE